MRMKKIFSMVIACMMLVCAFFATTIPASAATCSNGTTTRTITVVTKANWWVPGGESITLSQTKGTCQKKTYNIFTRKSSVKNTNVYGRWNIVAVSTDGKHTVKKSLTGSSVKIPLKPDKTYKVTVQWDSQEAIFTGLSKGRFISYPTWKVKSTYKVSQCY